MDENVKLDSAEESLTEDTNRHEMGRRLSYETTRRGTRRKIAKRRRTERVRIILAIASVPAICLVGYWISTWNAPHATGERPAIHASTDHRGDKEPTGQGKTSAPAHLAYKRHRHHKSSSGPATSPAARPSATNTGTPQLVNSSTSIPAPSPSDSPTLTRAPAPTSSPTASPTPASVDMLSKNLLAQITGGIQGLIGPIGPITA